MAQHRKQCHIMCKLWCQLACKITGRGLRICEMLTSYRSLEAGRGRRPIARSSWSMIAISSSVARWIVVPHGQLISLFSLNHVTVFCICAPHLGHTTGSTQFSRTPDILISLCLLHFVRWSPNPTTVGAAAYTLAIYLFSGRNTINGTVNEASGGGASPLGGRSR